MLTKPTIFLILKFKLKSDKKNLNFFIPISLLALYILFDSIADILWLIDILSFGKIKLFKRKITLKNLVNASNILNALLFHIIWKSGNYDFVDIETGDEDDKVELKLATR